MFVTGTGNQTPRIRTTATALSYVPSTGTLTANNFTAVGDVTAFSDKTLKDIDGLLNGTDIIDNLMVYRYRMKGSDQNSMGVIAQEIDSFAPEFVFDTDGIKSVNYSKLAIAAVYQEKMKRINLENQIELLTTMVERLDQEVGYLRNLVER